MLLPFQIHFPITYCLFLYFIKIIVFFKIERVGCVKKKAFFLKLCEKEDQIF